MHTLIASEFLGDYLILRPGYARGIRIPRREYDGLVRSSNAASQLPGWLVTTAREAWDLDLAGRDSKSAVLVRPQPAFGFRLASYELNLGCNYDCEHCYLGRKSFGGLDWTGRERLLRMLGEAGVLWLQLTGGEPLIDPHFDAVYRLADQLGMMLTISSNGSRLASDPILRTLVERRPYRIVVSAYGATAESYERLTRRRGSFAAFVRGLDAAREAELPVRLNLIVTRHDEHEIGAMRCFAEDRKLEYVIYSNMSPTIYGGPESLPAQAVAQFRPRRPFTGCNAGHTFFHVDPYGRASICKVGRDPQVSLTDEGIEGLRRLGDIADRLLLRQGGCIGCGLSGSCGTCMPLAALYRKAEAPLRTYCQHVEEDQP